MPRRRILPGGGVATIVAALVALLVAVGPARSAGVSRFALGVSVPDPGKPAELDSYVAAVGRNPAVVMWFQTFDEPLFYSDQLRAVKARGAISMITWEPSHEGRGIPLRRIAAGADDAYVRAAASRAVAWGKPLFIRFAPEMNVSSSPWGPKIEGNTSAEYVAAWRHVVTIFRAAGASNVAWVWSPNVNCNGRCPFDSFYPGDSWVDWVALDGYNYGPVADMPWLSMARIFGRSYDAMTALTRKPLMIAETASTELGGDKAAWIRQSLLRDIPERLPHVRLVIWFQRDAETDWRVDSSPAALAAFRAVAASPLYGSRPAP